MQTLCPSSPPQSAVNPLHNCIPTMPSSVHLLRVFAEGENGGNPLPVVVDAAGMTDADMQSIATRYGHESGFVFPGPDDYDFEFRFWVPEHEMEMCGHATIGAVWMLEKMGRLQKDSSSLRILTRSGPVEATVMRSLDVVWVEVSQEQGVVHTLADVDGLYADIVSTLGITKDDLIPGFAIQNCQTSRIKTVIPIKNGDILHGLKPRFQNVRGLCERIGSTGLYPYSINEAGRHIFDARQFPKSSGYVEDAATGIAASALSFALLENGLVRKDASITIRQGQAMGAPSQIGVRFRINENDLKVNGCWIRGTSILADRLAS